MEGERRERRWGGDEEGEIGEQLDKAYQMINECSASNCTDDFLLEILKNTEIGKYHIFQEICSKWERFIRILRCAGWRHCEWVRRDQNPCIGTHLQGLGV